MYSHGILVVFVYSHGILVVFVYSHGILVVLVVLLAKCLKRLTNACMQGLPMRLYTRWPRTLHLTTNWLLGVAVVLGPSAMFRSLFSRSEMALQLLRLHWRHC